MTMPQLARQDWYDLARDMNWTLRYVTDEEAFPRDLAGPSDIADASWRTWDEPYKVTYADYVRNQSEKDTQVYAVKNAIARSNLFKQLDRGWLSTIFMHYGALAAAEYMASIAEARMARFGRAAAWRNMASYGALDEMRHAQIQLFFPHGLLNQDYWHFDWVHRFLHSNNWAAVAVRHMLDDMATGNHALGTATTLTYVFETGFTNLQFLGMAADAMKMGDVEFGTLISSIQTDESRHAQQGEPTLRILLKEGKKDEAQQMIDRMFWRSWRVFEAVSGTPMDYYIPLENRTMSFKEFMQEWILKQFLDQFEDFGLKRPWYWDIFVDEINWVHHSNHLGYWFWRPVMWWDPDVGISEAERAWLEEKYPGWNDSYGKMWDTITPYVAQRVNSGELGQTLPATLPVLCNLCQLPIVRNPARQAGVEPYPLDYQGRHYTFCSEPCRWIFETAPERYQGHLSIVDRFVAGQIQPPTLEGAVQYMGIRPELGGKDGQNFRWAVPDRDGSHSAVI